MYKMLLEGQGQASLALGMSGCSEEPQSQGAGARVLALAQVLCGTSFGSLFPPARQRPSLLLLPQSLSTPQGLLPALGQSHRGTQSGP